MTERTQHDGDCTIYACLHNGGPECGICTCGYGWQEVRKGDWSKMYSGELKEKMELLARADVEETVTLRPIPESDILGILGERKNEKE